MSSEQAHLDAILRRQLDLVLELARLGGVRLHLVTGPPGPGPEAVPDPDRIELFGGPVMSGKSKPPRAAPGGAQRSPSA